MESSRSTQGLEVTPLLPPPPLPWTSSRTSFVAPTDNRFATGTDKRAHRTQWWQWANLKRAHRIQWWQSEGLKLAKITEYMPKTYTGWACFTDLNCLTVIPDHYSGTVWIFWRPHLTIQLSKMFLPEMRITSRELFGSSKTKLTTAIAFQWICRPIYLGDKIIRDICWYCRTAINIHVKSLNFKGMVL